MQALLPAQARVVGCLLEKELTTPDNYPLSMNSLLAACNQTSNRTPVVTYDEPTVSNAIENLRAEGLVRVVYSRSNRVDKYRHVLDEVLDLEAPERAVLAVMLLRGPQTTAELRARTERLHAFDDERAIEAVLEGLARRQESLAVRLERRPGQKEARWAQLMGGVPAPEDYQPSDEEPRVARTDRTSALETRIEALEEEVTRLRADHEALDQRLRAVLE
jgi:uncharacterized protein YceH (UPF0502 family)